MNERGKSLKGARVLVLGAAYKKDSDDLRESPSLKLIGLLRENGAEVSYNDPYLPTIELPWGEMESVALTEESLASADCVVIATDHSYYYNIGQLISRAKLVFDSRGATRGLKGDNIVRLGE
jgi:UDP-N-acetyl-D-glucosamine dehydrogenase